MGRKVILLDVKYIKIEGGARLYTNGICPTILGRDYKDPFRIAEYEESD